MSKVKITRFPISRQINENFKDYAIYTLCHRGIPDFNDSLTNIQRLILLSAKNEFTKSISVIGDVIKNGYHHGNMSAEKSLARLARPFNVAGQLLEGDGFFGTHVSPSPSAARYTSVRINKDIRSIIDEYSHLNIVDEDENRLPLNIDVPIGLLLPVIGIAVGYRTLILPRKLSDLQNYISGKSKSCEPYFKDYPKKLYKKVTKEDTSVWLFEAAIEVNEKDKTIGVTNLPPVLGYDVFIKKLDKVVDEFQTTYKNISQLSLINNSKNTIDITIKLKNCNVKEVFDTLVGKIRKITSLVVQENIVLVKDNKVLQYKCIEDYLEDFKVKNEYVYLENIKYRLEQCKSDIAFYDAKFMFLNFMFGNKRNDDEVLQFFKQFSKDIALKLDSIKARNITKEEIQKTKDKLENLHKLLNEINIEYKNKLLFIDKLDKNMRNHIDMSISALEDKDEVDGIEIYKFEEDEETIENY